MGTVRRIPRKVSNPCISPVTYRSRKWIIRCVVTTRILLVVPFCIHAEIWGFIVKSRLLRFTTFCHMYGVYRIVDKSSVWSFTSVGRVGATAGVGGGAGDVWLVRI